MRFYAGKLGKSNFRVFSSNLCSYFRITVIACLVLASFVLFTYPGSIQAAVIVGNMTLEKPILKMRINATEDMSKNITLSDASSPTFSWSSSNDTIATVSSSGLITAKTVGDVTITATNLMTTDSISTNLSVVPDPVKNIVIGAYVPPATDGIQYDSIRDAGIDRVHINSGNILAHKNEILPMLTLAAERGFTISVNDEGQMAQANVTSMSDSAIREVIRQYKNLPGYGGYQIADEPPYGAAVSSPENIIAAMPSYAHVYNTVLAEDPNTVPYLNMNKMSSNGMSAVNASTGKTYYQEQLETYISSVGASNLKMLSFDIYPYYDPAGFDTSFYPNLQVLRREGLAHGVDTGAFIQTVGYSGHRNPTENEMRFQASVSLAYGYKSLTYFTWNQYRTNLFPTGGIVDVNGIKTSHYPTVVSINQAIHTVGPILVGLDAQEVYHYGTVPVGEQVLPPGYIINPSQAADIVVSEMHSRTSNSRYIMVVNKDTVNNLALPLSVQGNYDISEVSKFTQGDLNPVSTNNTTFTATIPAGDFVLYKLIDRTAVSPQVSLQISGNSTVNKIASLSADASDNLGVTRVDFYNGSTKIGSDSTAPYSINWDTSLIPNGTYNITATAFDGDGNSSVSDSPVQITVQHVTQLSIVGSNNSYLTLSGNCYSSPGASTAPAVNLTDSKVITSASFTAQCISNGQTVDVSVALDTIYDSTTLVVMKSSATGGLTDITYSVGFSTASINGKTVTVAKYTVVDGGAHDEDGSINGVIVDPVYIASRLTSSTSGHLSNTGESALTYYAIGGLTSIAGLLGITIIYRRHKNYF